MFLTVCHINRAATGARGATGAAGADGLIGEINGVVNTAADLPPGGAPQGEIYYVADDPNPDNNGLYVWDTDPGWVKLGVAEGPRGATGPAGADGLIGEISGVVNAAADLPPGGAPQGEMYYVANDPEPDKNGVYVYDSALGWVKLGLAAGPRGPAGPTGATGDTGPMGPVGTAYTIVPFASTVAPKMYASNQLPTRISLLGFGYGDGRGNLTTLDDYSIALNAADQSFNLSSASNRQLALSMPFDMVIKSIAITVGNFGNFSPSGVVFPYVQLYYANAASNSFMPIAGALAVPEQGLGGGGEVPANTMRSVLVENLNIPVSAGTRIAIAAMMKIEGDASAREYYLYYTGALGLIPFTDGG